MRVFLIGATGFIGNAVARALARGHDVTGFVRRSEQGASLARDVVGSGVDTLQDAERYAAAWRAHGRN